MKHTYPAPEYGSIFQMLPQPKHQFLHTAIKMIQGSPNGPLHIYAELSYTHSDGRTSVVQRYGESLGVRKPDLIQGCAFRAAFRLSQWLEDRDLDEVCKLHLWNNDLTG